MKMLAPWLIPALLLALLPIVIHLLNRLRYKTVPWAAMMFLIKASKSSTRNARLRQWLILASRCLAVFFFVMLFTRPIVGGWFGSVMAGKPELVLLCLDRSASMEVKDNRIQKTKREQAIDLWIRAAKEMGTQTRFVLVEHVLREPQTIASPEALRRMAVAGPTDTAADMPSVMRAALDYLKRTPGEKAELWIASDLQESNWHPDSREWNALAAQFNDLPQDVQLRLMPLLTEPKLNVSVSLPDVKRVSKDSLELRAHFQRTPDANPDGFTSFIRNLEIPQTLDLTSAQDARLPVLLPVDEKATDGWGWVELPADENIRDNRGYFVFGGEAFYPAVSLAQMDGVADTLALAVFPDGRTRACRSFPNTGLGDIDLLEEGLVMWQGPAPGAADLAQLKEFVEQGGVLMHFPPGNPGPGLFGLEWTGNVVANPEDPLEIDRFDELDGPLANASDGMALPVRKMKVRTYQDLVSDDRWQVVATLTDGGAFLLQRNMGQGRVFAVTTLPTEAWSDLGAPSGAAVLVPMVQRMLKAGSQRLSRVRTANAGEWRPTADQSWEALDTEVTKDPFWDAGVYRDGPRLLALNRPSSEDDPARLDVEQAKTLFPDLALQVLGQDELAPDRKVYTEIWRFFIYLALLFLLFEGMLLLMERKAAPVKA